MIKETQLTIQEVEDHNLSAAHTSDSANSYICVRCRRTVSWESSYSNNKRNLHCAICITELAQEHNLTVAAYLRDYIWKA